MIDCFDGMVISWPTGTRPDAELVNTMLDAAIGTVSASGERPVVPSHRCGHYLWPGWLSRIAHALMQLSDAQDEGFLADMCDMLLFSVSGYRAWRRGGKHDHTRLSDPQAVALMRSIRVKVKGAYGSSRMHLEMQGLGHRIGLGRVERLMREHGMRIRHKGRFKAATDSKHSMPVAPNLLERNFTPVASNLV